MDQERKKIVAGIDGSEGSLVALTVALREAALWDATLEVVLAWDFLNQPGEFDPHYTQDHAESDVRDLVADSIKGSEVPVIPRAVTDRAADALLDAGRDADLLVVGARGKGGFLGLRLGSVSQSVVTHSRRPVMVVRGGVEAPEPRGGTVVVGIDGSEYARRALGWARNEAAIRGAELIVVHGWAPPLDVMTVPSATEAFVKAAQDLVEGEVAWVRETAPDLAVEGRTVTGSAAGAILDVAADAELVVVGGRGRGGFRGLLLGSVSQQVVNHAETPVVVVPEPPVV